MFVIKNKYYLIIESTKDINIKNIKKPKKFSIIYRKLNTPENEKDLLIFRNDCKFRKIDFYVANNFNLAIQLNSDGIYLSSYNKSLKALSFKNKNFHIIGSAHNHREIYMKIKQGCEAIIFSKLFSVNYDPKASFLGVIKFNNFLKINKNLVPLGGININNLNNLRQIKCNGFALMSEVKKKPAKIFSRLF